MNTKTTTLAACAVAAGVLGLGGWFGWFGHQDLEERAGPGYGLRGYDATSPVSTAPLTENVFTGRVTRFDGTRDIEGWTQDLYQVEVFSVLRGDLRGTVRVTYGLDEGFTDRLQDGRTYVFATHAWEDVPKNGHAHLFQGPMTPVDEAQLTAWRAAVALPMAPDQ
ncbi:hypothetical protein AB0M38_24245 [Streptomyces sp. NPDC051742]|uniref:hypothetical protein n=1 Tax=unclassified Streptomyces TaxID=2593676 RepID=UPI0034426AA2